MSLGMNDRWLEFDHAAYFLPNNQTNSWYVEQVCGDWCATMDMALTRFKTQEEAMNFIEATYELGKV